MTPPLTLLLEATVVRAMRGTGESSRTLVEVAWSPEAPDAMVDAVRAQIGTSSDVVLVVGLAFLEIAQPELPPIDAASARAVLWRDGDRYFPLSEPIAVVSRDGFALALPSRMLDAWVRACRALGPVRTVLAAPMVCAQVLGTGTCRLPAGDQEVGVVTAKDGQMQSVRRAPRVGGPGPSSSADADVPAMDPVDLLRAARESVTRRSTRRSCTPHSPRPCAVPVNAACCSRWRASWARSWRCCGRWITVAMHR